MKTEGNPKKITRRQAMKVAGAAVAGLAVAGTATKTVTERVSTQRFSPCPNTLTIWASAGS